MISLTTNVEWWLCASHLIATLLMCGIIWWVQIVHYPMFSSISSDDFKTYHARNVERTTWVVAPVMLTELSSSIALVMIRDSRVNTSLLWLALAILIIVWVVTVLISLPNHSILSSGFDTKAHRRLVSTNWIRTIGWTLRAALAVVMLHQLSS